MKNGQPEVLVSDIMEFMKGREYTSLFKGCVCIPGTRTCVVDMDTYETPIWSL